MNTENINNTYVETINAQSAIVWSNCLKRNGAFPLDRTDLFDSYADALLYAGGEKAPDVKDGVSNIDKRGLKNLAYIGQKITVYGPNENGENGVWHYTLVKPESGVTDRLAVLRLEGSGIMELRTYSDLNNIITDLGNGKIVEGQTIKINSDITSIDESTHESILIYAAGFYIAKSVDGSLHLEYLQTGMITSITEEDIMSLIEEVENENTQPETT